MDDELIKIRSAIRTDLTTVGKIPTGDGIQLIAKDDPAQAFALLCEAMYVQIYDGRTYTQIMDYLSGPLRVEDDTRRKHILETALHVRSALARRSGDHNAAYKRIMRDQGAEKDVVQKTIEACVLVSKEYEIPWDKVYQFEEIGAVPASGFGWFWCFMVLVFAALIWYGIYLTFFHNS